jgi:hypothetical protein
MRLEREFRQSRESKMKALHHTIKSALFAVMAAGFLMGMVATAEAGGRGTGPVIYVTGQDLFYDSIVLTDLPPRGPFQKLEAAGPSGLQTEFGPGDQDFVGGRWWLDANDNGKMDDGDAYFMCPLLGPGRSEL